jgi:AcrR family transcriptional regulator
MSDNPLPSEVELLWGRREPPRRGPRPSLSLEKVVGAAVEIADREGLQALSMARVAERIGSTPMSLYRYVRNKDELLQLMIDAAAAQKGPPEPDPDQAWRFNLDRWARALADLYRAHRWSLQAPIGPLPPIGPGQLAWLDRGLACLTGTRLAPEMQIGVIMLLLTYIRGEVGFTQEVNRSMDRSPPAGTPTYGEMLRRLVTADQLPALAELVFAGVFDEPDPGISEAELVEMLDFGLGRLLDGIGVLVEGLERDAP